MRRTRPVPPSPVLLTVLAVTTAGSLLLTPHTATADRKPVTREEAEGPGAPGERSAVDRRAATAPASAAARALTAPVTGLGDKGRGYPREQTLSPDPVNPADRSIKLGLTPYHAIAPKLNALQRLGDRVSVEVAGRSAGGHRLYLVTVTAPESAAQTRAQEDMRELIENAPAAAAKSRTIKRSYKAPVFVNNNIHGNEWEGTDASLKIVERLATATDARTRELLAHSRLYFNITANPDGRIAGTRANANGFDLNRDFVTSSQPEGRAMRQIEIDKQPTVMLDLHGYVNGTLIEPTTPPHGENYEYDLFLKNTYANALGMEAAVNDLGYTPAKDGVEPAQIPFRDQQEGWDDWPPIFTPQYAAFHGTVAAHTVEIPMTVNNRAYDTLSVAELRRRSAINVAVAGAAIDATFDYVQDHRTSLVADQIEVFRRGATGAAQVPVSAKSVPGVPGIGPEDVYTTTFPRAYVIPAGASGRRSTPAAARLVDHLLANDIRVGRASHAFRLDGRTYAKGSYVVDMRQPKRGLANVLLADGRDISDKVSVMYDISGWSLGRLWGATVRPVGGGSLSGLPLRAVTAATRVGYVAPQGKLRLRLDDPREIAALNSLLRNGVSARRAVDGSAIVPASARRQALAAARTYDVAFEATKATGVSDLRRTRVAAAVTPGELFALREMNFEVTPVSTAVLDAGFDWAGTDVLFVSQDMEYEDLNPAARKALDAFLGSRGLVGRGASGAALNSAAGLLAVKPVEGNGDANGVVRVVNSGRSPVTGGAPDHGFVYAPVWFTDLGPGVRVDQSYGSGNPLVSGHWRPFADGSGGPGAAAGQAAVVSGPHAVLFGTEPLFRDHPKGEFAQVARALLSVPISTSSEESE
ncbi:M14 family zinc carboxypeptidase [Streptomyces turgidiscabies]|uniref:Zinc carboxypeptidase n=1 Tax=Streptomyces turgidiscabies (strain Car8) TaxID=698760 RepID=L7FFC0_STRT8|nr:MULTISPECIES: M14 family zinc carboxypeptidase [Streptomyces]ELP70073.1 zinc carboxypeptidase [Streptomyces turgidiscabies Car8]MDX3494192.1 M14 family zinc carboxypeptidase [Streptomyces turgidiscabies]GAQ68433.1 murein peptide amidase A [Streptomyces turgidiscabies]